MVTASPLETLLSYAQVFAAGVGSVVALWAYGRAQRERGWRLGRIVSAP